MEKLPGTASKDTEMSIYIYEYSGKIPEINGQAPATICKYCFDQ